MPDTDRDEADLLDLAPLYALDAVDAGERAAIDERLARADAPLAARFADTVDRTHDVLAELSLVDAVPPPPELEGRLLAALDRLQQEPVRDIRSARRFSGKRLGWLATAAAVLVAAAVGGAVLVGRDSGSTSSEITAARVIEQPDARAATVAVPSGGSLSVNSSSALGAAAISFAAMPELPADRDYQLWIIPPGGTPQPAAVVPGSGEVIARYETADTIAITVEPTGGSQAPSGSPIAAMVMD
ncbi:anti-sigma factor domain-containing protein [Nocardia sp. NPDC057353]|uniref:anti-sigma factor n=1 Tax=Nocardia sp. NPDC057353 TaxID=3346104 RepID=UPI00362D29F3